MKRFNYKDPKQQRWILVPGLLLALGFSLNLSPEATHLAKLEARMNSVELAQTAPSTPQTPAEGPGAKKIDAAEALKTEQKISVGEIDLGEFDNGLKGVRVKYAVNGSSSRVSYNLEAESSVVCSTCVGIQEIPLAKDDIAQLEFFKRALAKDAMKKIEEKNARKEKPATGAPTTSTADSVTKCTMELADGLLSCLKEEVKAMAANCDTEAGRKDMSCVSKTQAFYRKNVQKSMQQALSSATNSEVFQEAVEIRDELIMDLSSKFDRNIRGDLINLTTRGVLARGERSYNRCLMTGCLPGYAATVAKSQMQNEINPYNRFAVGGRLAWALTDYGSSSKSGSPDAMQDVFMSSFYNPVFDLIKQNSQNGMKFNTNIAGEGSGTGPLTPPGLQSPNGDNNQYPSSPNSRQGSRGQGPQAPAAYGNPRANGLPSGGPGQQQWGTQPNNNGQWNQNPNQWNNPQYGPNTGAPATNYPSGGLRARVQ